MLQEGLDIVFVVARQSTDTALPLRLERRDRRLLIELSRQRGLDLMPRGMNDADRHADAMLGG